MDNLEKLARAYGIVPEGGAVVPGLGNASQETIVAVLTALGVDVSSPARIELALRHLDDEEWRRMLPSFVTVVEGQARTFFVHVSHGAAVDVVIELEGGGQAYVTQVDNFDGPRLVDGQLTGRAEFRLEGLPVGYHQIVARSGAASARTTLLCSPARLAAPCEQQLWGLMAQAYSVRSRQSWGIGDFADLRDLLWITGRKLGGHFVLINPTHAGEPVGELTASPYLPSSRRFIHPLYIRVEDIPETAYLASQERSLVEWQAEPARALNTATGPIDRDQVWEAKKAALEVVFCAPRSPARELEFAEFVQEQGEALAQFSLWCALVEHVGTVKLPAEFSSPTAPAVVAISGQLAERRKFYQWLQWVADAQLGAAQAAAQRTGMSIGLMADLAVGVHEDGADAWRLRDVLVPTVAVGSPPDYYNQQGQSWSQPPWNPLELARVGYAPFRDMVRSILRHAGAVRIDHIIGMFRTWWIPAGMTARQGVYVRIDHEALIGILLVEAQRAGAVVIGEDLGIVEPWVREYLERRGVLGTSVLWFEKDYEGNWIAPEHYRRLALATVTTHDLPPTAGYLAGEQVELRARLGLLDDPVEWERQKAAAERAEVVQMLAARGLVSADPSEREIIEALHVYLRAAPSLLLGVALTDAVGERRTQNQPGTDAEYPNWKIPLADSAQNLVFLEDLLANQRLRSLVAALNRPR